MVAHAVYRGVENYLRAPPKVPLGTALPLLAMLLEVRFPNVRLGVAVAPLRWLLPKPVPAEEL